jgi:SNF2 family DNA or RNA helicase
MITIELKESVLLKDEKESLFVSFPYNLEHIGKIKSLKVRRYYSFEKSWEVPIRSINEVLELFKDEEIKIKAPRVVTECKFEETKQGQQTQVKEIEDRFVSVSEFKFKTEPFKHQIESFEYAMKHAKFLLGDDQGLGKTKQAIDIAVARKGQFKHCLIVCGVNGLKRNWLDEIKIHSNESGHIIGSYYKNGKLEEGSLQDRLDDLRTLEDVDDYFLITNIETLRKIPQYEVVGGRRKKRTEFSKEELLRMQILDTLKELIDNGTIGMVIIDEFHKCKNPKSQQGQAIQMLRSKYRMALTGTPLMNDPRDLYNLLYWLEVEQSSYYQFENYYCVKGGYGGYEVVGYKNMDKLRAKLDSVMLRRKKEDVLGLPPKIRKIEYVQMTPAQRKIYEEIRAGIEKNLDQIALSPNPLAELIRLRQATGYTGILSSTIKESAKLDRLEEIIEELVESGQKAIVFSNWEDMTKVARERLKRFNPAYYTGSVDEATRQAEKNRFQDDPSCKVLIGTIGAMGTGLTLTAAQTVIFLDKPWNPANTVQAEDRAHRIGTKGTVNIITLVCENTIDERIEEILEEKGDIFDALVEGNMDKLSKLEMLKRLIA